MAQPSRVDTGSCPADVVGTLQRAVLSTSVDGAVSSLSGRTHSCEIVEIGAVAGTAAASIGMAVRKRGRTTGLTHGTVDSISLSVNVDYGDGIGNRILTNQIGIAPNTALNPSFGERGDSGSVVVNASRQVVGLYFAGWIRRHWRGEPDCGGAQRAEHQHVHGRHQEAGNQGTQTREARTQGTQDREGRDQGVQARKAGDQGAQDREARDQESTNRRSSRSSTRRQTSVASCRRHRRRGRHRWRSGSRSSSR